MFSEGQIASQFDGDASHSVGSRGCLKLLSRQGVYVTQQREYAHRAVQSDSSRAPCDRTTPALFVPTRDRLDRARSGARTLTRDKGAASA